MDIRKLQRAIVDGLEDVKAQNIVVFNTEAMSPLFERVIIASGTSNRQTKALASSVRETVRERGMQVLRTEGEDNGEWIIVDCGAAVAHIMQPAIREYYHLEEIWGGKPVKLKAAEAKGLPKAGDAAAAEAKAASAKKTAAKKTAARSTASAAAPQPAAKKAPAKKTAAKTTAAKTTTAKTTTAKKAPGKTSAKTSAKAPAKVPAKAPAKTPARKATAKRPHRP